MSLDFRYLTNGEKTLYCVTDSAERPVPWILPGNAVVRHVGEHCKKPHERGSSEL